MIIMNRSYTVDQFRPHILRRCPEVIVECGARDCLDSLDLVETYQPNVLYAFECNPYMLEICRQNAKLNPRIHLIESAVTDKVEERLFHVVPNCINAGASSFYPWIHTDAVPTTSVCVQTTRLDTFMDIEHLSKIDLLCMDIQGSELSALRGLGPRIFDVGAIVLELFRKPHYIDAPLYDEIDTWLRTHGFTQVIYEGSPEDFFNGLYTR